MEAPALEEPILRAEALATPGASCAAAQTTQRPEGWFLMSDHAIATDLAVSETGQTALA
jgi:hypothetical protein